MDDINVMADKACEKGLMSVVSHNEDGDMTLNGRRVKDISLTDADIVVEGKSKKFYRIADDMLFMVFKPHLRSITSKREENIVGTDISRLKANLFFSMYIEKTAGVPTHILLDEIVEISGMKGLLVSPAKTVPIEFIKRYYAKGSIVRLFPTLVSEGEKLPIPLSKYDFKQDVSVSGVDDPTLNESYIVGLGLMNRDDFEKANQILDKTAEALNALLAQAGIRLNDFKMEIGYSLGRYVVIDEISQDCIRADSIETGEPLTKDAFRNMKTPEEVCDAYIKFNRMLGVE